MRPMKIGMIVMFSLGLLAATAFAGDPAYLRGGAKMTGEFGGANRSAARGVRHAIDYSRDLRQYSGDVKKVKPDVAKAHAAEIGRNLNVAKKDFAQIRKEAGTDKAVAAHLDAIEQHLTNATKLHKDMENCCQKDDVPTGELMTCCDGVIEELEKAAAEHEKLAEIFVVKESRRKVAPKK